ncbi:MAG: hypothetical protein HQL30_10830 [Candidatus Omnitrophica bacterium]|nr:hypothetical protein [Candidatus Omnitrophota bacterium]
MKNGKQIAFCGILLAGLIAFGASQAFAGSALRDFNSEGVFDLYGQDLLVGGKYDLGRKNVFGIWDIRGIKKEGKRKNGEVKPADMSVVLKKADKKKELPETDNLQALIKEIDRRIEGSSVGGTLIGTTVLELSSGRYNYDSLNIGVNTVWKINGDVSISVAGDMLIKGKIEINGSLSVKAVNFVNQGSITGGTLKVNSTSVSNSGTIDVIALELNNGLQVDPGIGDVVIRNGNGTVTSIIDNGGTSIISSRDLINIGSTINIGSNTPVTGGPAIVVSGPEYFTGTIGSAGGNGTVGEVVSDPVNTIEITGSIPPNVIDNKIGDPAPRSGYQVRIIQEVSNKNSIFDRTPAGGFNPIKDNPALRGGSVLTVRSEFSAE